MAAQDRPFSDTEKVNLLAEIIKSSNNVRPESLLDIIYEYNVETQWQEIVRPPGRSPQACKQTFDDLRARHPGPTQRAQPFYQPPQPPFIPRQYVPLEPVQPIAPGRNIQPRPQGVPSTQYSPTSSPYTHTPPEQTFKKRGRPTNAEKEQRKQEYEARGETYPPPRSRKRSKATTASQAATSPKTAGSAPLSAAPEEGSVSSSKQGSLLGHSPRSPPYGRGQQASGSLAPSPRVMEPPPTSVPRRQSPYDTERPYQPQPPFPQYPSQYSHTQSLTQQPPPQQPQTTFTPISQQPYHSPYTSAPPSHGMRLPRPISTSTPGPSSGPPPTSFGYARLHEPGLPPPLQIQQQQQQQGGPDSGTSSGEPPQR